MSTQDDDRQAVAAPEFDPVLEALAATADDDVGWLVDPHCAGFFALGYTRARLFVAGSPREIPTRAWVMWRDRASVEAGISRSELQAARERHGNHIIFVPRAERHVLLSWPRPSSGIDARIPEAGEKG